MHFNQQFQFNNIGYVQSPYKEKFAVPRQPNIVTKSECKIILDPNYANEDAIKGLADFSHIWVQFVFHQNPSDQWHALVRPPRLGGNKKIGVYASRSPFRPNPIGLSNVEYVGYEVIDKQVVLNVRGGDFVDGTPILDIKPYIEYADCVKNAKSGFAKDEPIAPLTSVNYSSTAAIQKEVISPQFIDFIECVLLQDPRPAYKKNKEDNKIYSVKIGEFDIKFEIKNNALQINEFKKLM